MKTKQFLFCLLALIGSGTANAYDFKQGDIYYNITSTGNKTVEVTSGDNLYKGVVTIPPSVTYDGVHYRVSVIGSYAFRFCGELIDVTIPESVDSIGDEAFEGCGALSSITIPEGVAYIGKSVFPSVKNLRLPSTLKEINQGMLCGEVTNLYYNGTLSDWCNKLTGGGLHG